MAAFIVAVLVLSLTTNLIPLFNIVAILSLFPLHLFWSRAATPDRRLGPRTAVHFVLAAYAFWILSYLLTTAPVSRLFSYDFLRVSGALLVGYLPLFLVGDVRLSSRFACRLVWAYLVILAGVAILGAVLLLLLGIGHRPFLNVPILNNLLEIQPALAMPVSFRGLYRTHMTAGQQCALAALITLCFMLRTKRPRLLSWPTLVFISLLGGVILSGARTAYLALAATLLFQFVRKKRYSRALAKIVALLVVPTILFCLWQPTIFARAASIVYFEGDENVMGRFRLYRIAAEEFAQSPLIGTGFGRFSESGKTYYGLRHLVYIATGGEIATGDDVLLANQVHNSYLQFLAEGGLLGLFLMLGVWVATYRWAGRLRRRFEEGSTAGALCESVQAVVLLVFFSSFTGTTMVMATTPLVVFTMVGLLRNVASYECRVQAVKRELAVSRLGTPGLTGLIGPAEAG